ncbi:adenosylcobinamide-phosphate synthase CbiB [Athalassotoga saccharophila]|uniref:adenosylcobinamide-phosphate synthase CbiB n=1 Tax=Athalassotoga saccharophila TaxID=1441386 RepID=UPI0018D9F6BC|nr:adenosylcobinamide-phosphate synthase CbiB [Athalassotoga saccharophila]BBJ27994.1 cobalamin biosynthesis protein CobD [Athalassotoga saccharophila]
MNFFTPNIYAFLIAIGIDLLIGEYPNVVHPVVWMGKIVKYFENGKTPRSQFMYGLFMLVTNCTIWFTVGILTMMVPGIAGIIVQAFILKSTFSIRGLYEHVKRCDVEDEEKMRKAVSMIVSRDTSKLDRWHLISASLESLSENTSDSITGPLFYYTLFGMPGALLYRVINTMDAMVGYHTPRFEWFGKPAARLDDAMNFIPSRLTATFFAIFNPRRAFEYIFKYGPIKINGTYPMSAFAGLLGVSFEKIGVYRFDGRIPVIEDIKRGLKFYAMSVLIIISFFTIIMVVR